jgi:hypothetical protein
MALSVSFYLYIYSILHYYSILLSILFYIDAVRDAFTFEEIQLFPHTSSWAFQTAQILRELGLSVDVRPRDHIWYLEQVFADTNDVEVICFDHVFTSTAKTLSFGYFVMLMLLDHFVCGYLRKLRGRGIFFFYFSHLECDGGFSCNRAEAARVRVVPRTSGRGSISCLVGRLLAGPEPLCCSILLRSKHGRMFFSLRLTRSRIGAISFRVTC